MVSTYQYRLGKIAKIIFENNLNMFEFTTGSFSPTPYASMSRYTTSEVLYVLAIEKTTSEKILFIEGSGNKTVVVQAKDILSIEPKAKFINKAYEIQVYNVTGMPFIFTFVGPHKKVTKIINAIRS